jgi:hypothetical protein
MQVNGHHGPVPPPDHTSILIGFALRIGRLEGAVFNRQQEQPPLPPRNELMAYVIGAVILGAATFGKITWADALPSVLGLFGK